MKKIFILILLIYSGNYLCAQEKEEEITTIISCSNKDKITVDINDLSKLSFVNNLIERVTHFKLKLPGSPTISVNGNKLSSKHIGLIRTLKEGESIMVFSAKPCEGNVNGSKPLFIYFVK